MISKLPLLIFVSSVIFCNGEVFKIAWLVPGKQSTCKVNVGTSRAALNLAVNAVKKNPSLLKGHQIRVKVFETECDSSSGMMAAMTAQTTFDPDMFIGPPCKDAMVTVAKYGQFYNRPVYSWHNGESEFDDYENIIRLQPPLKYLAKSLVQVLGDIQATDVSLVYSEELEWTALKTSVEGELRSARIQVRYAQRYAAVFTDEELDNVLMQMGSYSTTIVFMMATDDVRRCMVSSVRTGMAMATFEFIHLDRQIYTDAQLKARVLGDGYWKRGRPDDQEAETGCGKLTHVIYDPMNDDQTVTYDKPRSRYGDFINLGQTLGQGQRNASGFDYQGMSSLDVYSLYLYDCLSMWAVLANQMVSQNVSCRDGKAMVQSAKAFYAEGTTGFINFDNMADRIAKVFVLKMAQGGLFTARRSIRFDATGTYSVQVVKTVTRTEAVVIEQSVGAPETVPGSEPTVPEPEPAQASTAQSTAVLSSLQAIIKQLKSLQQAVNTVVNHDHTRDHAPHEYAQGAYRPDLHTHYRSKPQPPKGHSSTVHRTHSSTVQRSKTLLYPGASTGGKYPSVKAKPSKGKATGALESKGSTGTISAQLMAKLTGVIDQKIGILKNATVTKRVPTTTTQLPTTNAEQGNAQAEYNEMLRRFQEEFAQEYGPMFAPQAERPPSQRSGAGGEAQAANWGEAGFNSMSWW